MYSKFDLGLMNLECDGAPGIWFDHFEARLAKAVLLYFVMELSAKVRPEKTRLFRIILEDYLSVNPDEVPLTESMVAEIISQDDKISLYLDEARRLPDDQKFEILGFVRGISLNDPAISGGGTSLALKTARLLEINS